jgi:hypothetical protein
MRDLYIIIILGIAGVYYINSLQKDEVPKVSRGQVSEGDFAQEAPPSNEEVEYIQKFIPDFV